MQITIELPNEIANQLQLQPANISRRILELIAADNYRQGRLGATQVCRMLNFSSRWETYEFLKREKAYLPYTEDDLEQDAQAIRNVLAKE
jgi:predicted HTH domain antitoxin